MMRADRRRRPVGGARGSARRRLGGRLAPVLGAGAVLALALLAARPAAAGGYTHPEAAPRREGFAGGFAVGPSIFLGSGGLGAKEGVGGDLNLRVGTSATPSFLWQLELQAGGYLVDLTDEVGTERIFNSHATLTLGGQLYVRESLWLRAGAGAASFHEQEGRNGPERVGTRRNGLALLAGGGYDLLRRGIFALDLELVASGAVFDGAFLGHSAIQVGLIWY